MSGTGNTLSTPGAGISDTWARAASVLGGRRDRAAADGAELESCYRQQHRRYHDGTHVIAVLRDSCWLAGELGLDDSECAVLALAVCAHDVVYDARPGADERASADWASSRLRTAGVPEGIVDQVAGLVLATISHDAGAEDRVADALLDADLAILAAPAAYYLGYVDAVRDEYAAVPDVDWRAGRAALLTGLLARPTLYRCAAARERWDAPARANVAEELSRLESP